MRAIQNGTLPDREATLKFYGLEPLVPEVIQTATLPKPTFPDWSQGRILTGVVEPQLLDLTKLRTDAWFHPHQTGENTRPTGYEILATLVFAYEVGKDAVGMTYQVKPTDLINGHFGLRELKWLEDNWKTLPEAFRKWAKGKLLYGWADVVRHSDGYLYVPCLDCDIDKPFVDWFNLDRQWDDDEPALREQVGTQS